MEDTTADTRKEKQKYNGREKNLKLRETRKIPILALLEIHGQRRPFTTINAIINKTMRSVLLDTHESNETNQKHIYFLCF